MPGLLKTKTSEVDAGKQNAQLEVFVALFLREGAILVPALFQD